MEMTSLTGLLVLVALAVGSNAGQNSLMSFKNNGYEGVLVAIHHSVKENLAMIDEIKKLFTSASPYLHTATRQRAYFRNVSILIPETWRDRPEYEKATLETFSKADFRVDHSNPVYGHVPYTKQPGECGEPAEYVHVTPEYVLDNGTNREYNWGDPGRVIVHEFAHLRYGVFDEYGLVEDENYPLFYVGANGRPTVTGCSSRVRGTYKVYDGKTARRCMLSRLTGLPEKDCRFYPFLTRNTAKASVMFYQFIDSVDSFCEMKATEPSMQHSQFAPNKQNKLCNTGTWDVIKEHEDFTGKEGQPREITDTEPSFRVLYPRRKVTSTGVELDGERLALVLDVSQSMNEKDRAFKVLQSATSFIRESVPLGIEVGVILFNNQALDLPFLGLRKLSSEADKDRLIGSLAQYMPNLVGGSTAIGQGLQKAKTMLSAGGRSLENAHIVLMSDGYETENPSVADVMKSDIEGTGIVVTAIGYGKVDDGLDVASKKSGRCNDKRY
ncbi:calcium-activated chloride channel regulator 4A-like [Lingula anatina]|uniref:Calcium-activated chloride channel regulator 4A-like n=1 Tax=Lingula anatina TaxID=7574 RepID=A0A2R2MK45_LINAN|nr:calcium-activated chloride channel regulator 4A-like [Lingula anatina]|eukprot:XP_023930432.1 calcium-activated chloride channel regulator 4A-like [Lingula anatina]